MDLITYSSDESEEERNRNVLDGKESLPYLYSSIRNFSEGDWLSSVAIHVPNTPDIKDEIESLLSIGRNTLKTELISACSPSYPYHLSLSRMFKLKYSEIKEFIQSVKSAMSIFSPFRMTLSGGHILVNDDRSKLFLGLLVVDGLPNLLSIISSLNDVMKQYNRLPYYDKVLPHVSIGKCFDMHLINDISRFGIETVYGDLSCSEETIASDTSSLLVKLKPVTKSSTDQLTANFSSKPPTSTSVEPSMKKQRTDSGISQSPVDSTSISSTSPDYRLRDACAKVELSWIVSYIFLHIGDKLIRISL